MDLTTIIEYLKAALFGVVEGITEWLPISSTGHMILLYGFLPLKVSEEFWNMFEVVIQLGAILAVVIIFWKQIWPFKLKEKDSKESGIKTLVKTDILSLWGKILVACIPAAVVGLLLDEILETYLYNNYVVVAIALIVFGIAFIVVETWNKDRTPKVNSLNELTYKLAIIIGMFQLLAAIFPGVSRSGATIVGALLIGVSRTVAAEFTFFLAIPVMAGASLLKLVKFGLNFTMNELIILIIGFVVAFVVSIIVIKFLLKFIKKHDFEVFGWYRIVLGVAVLIYFTISATTQIQ